jgi:hypothetical protein
MAYTNSYKDPDVPTLLPGYYGPNPYDINWIMPLHEATLESERVKLTPFTPSLHAKKYAEQIAAHPELHRYFVFNPSTLDEILTTIELMARRDPTWIRFAILDKAHGAWSCANSLRKPDHFRDFFAELLLLLLSDLSSNAMRLLVKLRD